MCQVVELFLAGAGRDRLDPILDACVAVYAGALGEDAQVDFKSKAKAFCRTYGFISSLIPYNNAEWEKLSILPNLLTPKLPAPQEEDLSKGILEAIDMDSYRVEKKAAMKIALADQDAEIEPVPTDAHGHKFEPELVRLSNIVFLLPIGHDVDNAVALRRNLHGRSAGVTSPACPAGGACPGWSVDRGLAAHRHGARRSRRFPPRLRPAGASTRAFPGIVIARPLQG
jgi:hypothetical protein